MYSISLLCLLGLASSAYGGYVKVFEDNFDGNRVNISNWKFETGNGQYGWGNGEREWYTDGSNVKVAGGVMTLTAFVGKTGGLDFGSTRLNSKESWTFGKFEIRAKLPKGKNLWPAIWMYPKGSEYGTWAASGEIDIVEVRGERPNEVQASIHYGAAWPNNAYSGSKEKTMPFDLTADFHTYAFEWSKTKMSWSVDGKEYHTENLDRDLSNGFPYAHNGQPFDKPFYLVINIAVGGGFFPANKYGPAVTVEEAHRWEKPTMEIDFVRVSQMK